jgi:hypothetical protein
MTAGYGLAGAPSSVTKVHIVAPSVYREVVAEVGLSQRVLPGGLSSGLSGLTRKCHGPFLGGWGAVMPPGYPTSLRLVETCKAYHAVGEDYVRS